MGTIRYFTALASLIMAGGCAVSTSEPAVDIFDVVSASAAVSTVASAEDRLRADVAFLADDARRGREAGTPGYDEAADYVALRMEALGLVPGNNGSWFQDVTLRTASSTPDASELIVTFADGSSEPLTFLDDFKVFPSTTDSEQSVTAPAVFASHGIYAPSLGINDYDNIDVDGKIVLRFTSAPSSLNSAERAHFGQAATKEAFAREAGALGMVSLFTQSTEESFPWTRYQANEVSRDLTWISADGSRSGSGGLSVTAAINAASSDLFFRDSEYSFGVLRAIEAGGEGKVPNFAMPITVTINGKSTFDDVTSANVVGMIEGTDPVLRDEVIVITAHLDHVGERAPDPDNPDADLINNGAMDNALGVAMMLETARRFRENPPARTIVFLALTAEEKGLIGADYFARNPTLGGKRMIANVNLDMPLMLHPFTDIVAFGAEHSTLGAIVEDALADAGVSLSPDPLPEQGIFTRSDHYRFVQQGVPSIFLWPGFANGGEDVITSFLATHYHRPSDDLSLPVLWGDAARFAEINFLIAQEISQTPTPPRWLEGDFFGDLFGPANQ